MTMKSGLRFDHREIAVIFSLFIFVSLLMFTVGILVGKGLTQAKYEGQMPAAHGDALTHAPPGHEGSSVSIGAPLETHPETKATHGAKHDAPSHGAQPAHDPKPAHETKPAHATAESHDDHTTHSAHAETVEASAAPTAPLKLVPLRPVQRQTAGLNLAEPKNETEALLKNPKIRSLIEAEDDTERSPNSAPAQVAGASKGSYTVQVGSYPNELAAKERVDALKKLGFQTAYFSANDLGAASGTWYRVWLGQYPDYQTAKKTGDQLQSRGEVKNYIVRKN